MCDFKVGDEVVCVDDTDAQLICEGTKYVVAEIGIVDGGFWFSQYTGEVGVALHGVAPSGATNGLWRACRFRKVQRRNSRLTLEAFFTVPGGFEEPKRAPAKTPERV